MTEVPYYKEATTCEIMELEAQIKDLQGLGGAEKGEGEKRANSHIRQVKKHFHDWKMAVKAMPQGTEKQQAEREMKEQEEKLKECEQLMKKMKKGVTIAEEGPAEGNGEGGRAGAMAALDEGIRIQNQDIDALSRVQMYAGHANTVADETINALAQQSDKIDQIDNDLNELDGQLQIARRQFASFVRTAMTDKCFLCLTFFLVALVVLAVVDRILKKD